MAKFKIIYWGDFHNKLDAEMHAQTLHGPNCNVIKVRGPNSGKFKVKCLGSYLGPIGSNTYYGATKPYKTIAPAFSKSYCYKLIDYDKKKQGRFTSDYTLERV
jgi:hypothetical protein